MGRKQQFHQRCRIIDGLFGRLTDAGDAMALVLTLFIAPVTAAMTAAGRSFGYGT